MFLALSPIIFCSIHPWFWNALYNVYTITILCGEEKKGMMNASSRKLIAFIPPYFMSRCKFKDCKIISNDFANNVSWRWSNWINKKTLSVITRMNSSRNNFLFDSRITFYPTNHFLVDFFVVKKLKLKSVFSRTRVDLIDQLRWQWWLFNYCFRVNRGFITQLLRTKLCLIKLYREIISSKNDIPSFWKFVTIGSLINVFWFGFYGFKEQKLVSMIILFLILKDNLNMMQDFYYNCIMKAEEGGCY